MPYGRVNAQGCEETDIPAHRGFFLSASCPTIPVTVEEVNASPGTRSDAQAPELCLTWDFVNITALVDRACRCVKKIYPWPLLTRCSFRMPAGGKPIFFRKERCTRRRA